MLHVTQTYSFLFRCFWLFFFFFKQKTAYEMRISDWSSDVCSSDLFTARCSIVQRAFKATTLAMCWRSGSGGASARSTRKRKVRAMADRPDFHVITGGPGSGKSTLIEALAVEGFDHMPEAGRAIIRDQVAIGGAALPWADR